MSIVGYYRYKTLADEEKEVNFTQDFNPAGTKTIVPVDFCEGSKILKYLDHTGQYRFYPFNQFYRTNDNPTLIGKTNKLITSILSNQSNTHNVGYNNERKIDLTAIVPNNELEKLTDIYTSPRVYLYIGDGVSDIDSDWLEVESVANQNIVRRPKANTGEINITVTLPEHFTIKMI